MYEDAYDMTESERAEVREVLADLAARGGRLTDAAGRPIPYRVLRGRRFLVCDKGMVWRFAPEGSPHEPGKRGGTQRRYRAIEMWTGKWRKAPGPDGEKTYAKCVVWVPLDDHVNGHSGISKLGWYRSVKGFQNPMAAPEAPSAEEIAELEGRREAVAHAVYARMQAEGLGDMSSSRAPAAHGDRDAEDAEAPEAPNTPKAPKAAPGRKKRTRRAS